MADLSIVIVTYKGWERLDKCLASLSVFSSQTYSKEVIVVDNTPDPEEISYIKRKYPDFSYLHNPVNGGYGYAVNRGAQYSSGKFLLVLNPDTVAAEDAIDILVSAVQNPELGIISCRQVNEKGRESTVTGSFPAFLNLTGFLRTIFRRKPFPVTGDIVFPDWVSGSVMLFRRDIFMKLNGFDEDFWMYYEDVDICRRVTKAGWKIALHTGAVIEHNHGGSSRTDVKTTAITKCEVNISRHVYISKHKKGPAKTGIQTFLVINNCLTGFIAAIPGLALFFIPKMFTRFLSFRTILSYYLEAAVSGSWVSRRSVSYKKKSDASSKQY